MDEYTNIDFYNHYFSNGDTCIHYAVRLRDGKFLYYLLKNGMNPNYKNRLTYDTPLHIAINNSDIKLIVQLMKFHADATIENLMGKTPINIAKSINNTDVIELVCDNDVVSMLYKNDDKKLGSKKPPIYVRKRSSGTSILLDNTPRMKFIDEDHDIDITSDGANDEAAIIDEIDDDIPDLVSAPVSTPPTSNTTPVSTESFDLGLSIDVKRDDNGQNGHHTTVQQHHQQQTRQRRMSMSVQLALKTVHSIDRTDEVMPHLCDWLQRLRTNIYPKIYVKRYVWIQDSHILWNDKKVTFDKNQIINGEMKKIYDGCVSLLMIKDVKVYKAKKDKEFKFQIICHNIKKKRKKRLRNNKDKIYLWKCYSQIQRDKWVNGLKKYLNDLNNIMNDIK